MNLHLIQYHLQDIPRYDDTHMTDTLKIVSHASHMLQHILNEVIDLTKLESGAVQVLLFNKD